MASKIKILASFDKKDFKEITILPYSNSLLVYDVDVSRMSAPDIYDAMYKLEFLSENNDIVDKTRAIPVFVKNTAINRGIIKIIQNDFLVASRQNGGKAYFIKVRKDKSHCSLCWDEDLKSSDNSNCQQCGGSGYMKTYFQPIKTIIGPVKNVAGSGKSTDEVGKIDNNSTISFTALFDYPLATDDIVFTPMNGSVLRVTSSVVSETQGNEILQGISAQILPSDSSEVEIIHSMLEKTFGERYAQ